MNPGARDFGPHELLLSSLVDALTPDEGSWRARRHRINREVQGLAKKGNGNILKSLQRDIEKYRGPVVAVIDRDKAHKLWEHLKPRPTNCIQGLSAQFHKSAPGSYELIFLVNHTEDLLDSALRAMGAPPLQHKPDPLERDDIFNRVAWSVPREVRVEVGQRCPSFQRIVDKISQHFIDR